MSKESGSEWPDPDTRILWRWSISSSPPWSPLCGQGWASTERCTDLTLSAPEGWLEVLKCSSIMAVPCAGALAVLALDLYGVLLPSRGGLAAATARRAPHAALIGDTVLCALTFSAACAVAGGVYSKTLKS